MNDRDIPRKPAMIDAIIDDTHAIGFDMASEPLVGALLSMLAASKPGGRLLELGTGTGHGTAWILAGMDAASQLDTVENDVMVLEIARRHLGGDRRVTFHPMDGASFIANTPRGMYDFIYADAWPGKFSHLDETLDLLKPGGVYVIDDLLPQPNWPEGHAPKVPVLIDRIEGRADLAAVKLAWASGIMIAVRRP
jgi:predicted O-methyltransferase YrrM